MHCYWAEFTTIGNDIFRFDTRIYLSPIENISTADFCIGAVMGKNPGSAKSMDIGNGITPIDLGGDKLLPTVRNIVIKAYQEAGSELPEIGYIQVLNLFYLCNPVLHKAITKLENNTNAKVCKTEKNDFPWIWYVWGGESEVLNKYKDRFKSIKASNHFFFDKNRKVIVQERPTPSSFAKHTQGLKHDYVVLHIAKLIKIG